MKAHFDHIDATLIDKNAGQIDGLPQNPREWTQESLDRLAKSLNDTPELFEARPILLVRHEGRFVVLGGNMRFDAAVQNKMEYVPAIILEDIDTGKMAEIVLKDNGAFGEWNFRLLQQEWSDIDLEELGIYIPELEDFGEKNTELDISTYDTDITLRLRYPRITAAKVKLALGEDKKKTLLKLLDYGNEDA